MDDEGAKYIDWNIIERVMPLQGYRTYVAFTYMGFNLVGFAVNFWVLYVISPLLFAPSVKVPKSILFFIFALCVSDLTTMIAMLLLIIDLLLGTWRFSNAICKSYLIFDSMNKFIAPIIVFLISRTCYATVCLNKGAGERAASLKYAMIQLGIALGFVMVLLSPVLVYSKVFDFYVNPNATIQEVSVFRKCAFQPPHEIVFYFNLIMCIVSYAIPLFGIIYWYVSVPFFLKRRALSSLVASSSAETAMKYVIRTVFLLTAIYMVCWTPYWISMFGHKAFVVYQRKYIVIFYFIHLLPYVSCVAYPLIFTLLNRGIRTAHAKIVQDQRRRFKSLTDDATTQVRSVIRGFPARSRNHSKHTLGEDRSVGETESTIQYPNAFLVVPSDSGSTKTDNESETLL